MRRTASVVVLSLAAATAAVLVLAGCTSSTPTAKAKPLTLTIGALLPQTGSFAALAPAETAGIKLAADDINTAGLGITVKVDYVDSGDATTAATPKAAVATLIKRNVDAVVGPTSNDVANIVVGPLTDAGIVVVSPQNSLPALTARSGQNHGLYFRTSPSDDAQGTALGALIEKNGESSLAILQLKDDYSSGIADALTTAYTKAGGSIASTKTFPAGQTDFTAEVAAIAKEKPNAVAVIAAGQTTTIVAALVAAGIPAKDLYFTDRNLLQYGSSMPVSLEGAEGVAAGPVLDAFFQKKVLQIDPTLTAFAYAPESYDAVVSLALAALDAQSVTGSKIAKKLPAVTGGAGKGEKATDFASAAQIILAGDAVDYDGYSGGIAFDANGDPSQAVIGVFRYGSANTFTRVTK